MMVKVGKTYKVFKTKMVKVVKVTDNVIHVVWTNGMVPLRQSDRLYPIDWVHHFVEVK